MNDRFSNRQHRHSDALAEGMDAWRRRSWYYHHLQQRHFRFLIPHGKRVLEIGCGRGDLLKALNPSYGVGVDFSPAMIAKAVEYCRDTTALRFIEADGENLTLDETFDYVILSDTIGSLSDIEETLRRLRPCCTAETRLIVAYYNYLWEPALKLAEALGLKMPTIEQSWLSPQDVANLLHLAGFDIVKTERKNLLPKKIPLLSAMVNRFIAPLPGINALCLNYYIVARVVPEATKNTSPSVTILIPCRNEKGNIADAIHRLPAFGSRQEIIFVDGHSNDGTPEEIRRVMAEYPDKDIKLMVQDGKGKGDAVRKGFAVATGDVLMILDADLTVEPEDLPKFYRALVSGKGEFINGCRLVYPLEKQAMRFLNFIANKFFGLAFTWLLGQRFKDTLCGTKVLWRKDYETLAANRAYFGDFDPFGDFDLIFGAAKMNLKIVELPIRYRERTYGTTNISRFQHGWLLLKMCVFAFRKLKAR